jgi:uncharacterized protein (UPF0333 family)
MKNNIGQSTLEYALIIAVVVAALMAINAYMRKGLQGRLKASSDQIGKQFDPTTFTTAYQTTNVGNSTTTESRDVSIGATTSAVDAGQTLTNAEHEDWGTAPGQHY